MAYYGGFGGQSGREGRGRDFKDRDIQTTKLFVGNLPKELTSEELRVPFEEYGDVVECDIVNGAYAFVHFKTCEQADAACKAMNDYEIHETYIRVQKSHSRARQKGGTGDRRTCHRCGGMGHWSKECPAGAGDAYDHLDSDRGGGRYGRDSYRDPYGSRDSYADSQRDSYPREDPLDTYIGEYMQRPGTAHLVERLKYLEGMLGDAAADDDRGYGSPYDRPPADAYNGRSSANTGYDVDYSTSRAGGDARRPSGGGKLSHLSDSSPPRDRGRPY